MKKNMKNGLLALFIGLVLLSGCESKKDTIHIATKPMSEQFILGEMLALLIEENSDLHVKITKATFIRPWSREISTFTRNTRVQAGW